MPRLIYSLLFYLAQPAVWLRLWWRARKQPEYLQHVGERYGHYPQPVPPRLLWLHAVSVGETRAAEPLIKALLEAYPDHSLLLTHMTPTGRATGGELIAKYGPRLLQAYLPYDLPGPCRRFFGHFRPRLGLLMETELWPNLIASAHGCNAPVLLVNARLSQRSQRGYLRFAPLIRPAVQQLTDVAAQTPADAARLTGIGAQDVKVFGNIKFDVTPAPEKLHQGRQWRKAFGSRPVWLAASTREGEEPAILDAFVHHATPDTLLLLVPRHPQRFDEVAALASARGLALQRRSTEEAVRAQTRVLLGDSMGEMFAYYAAADVALIGGSWLPFGGQNLIEACAVGTAAVIGPHTFNFQAVAEDAERAGAAIRAQDAEAGMRAALAVVADPARRDEIAAAGRAFATTHQGATARSVALLRAMSVRREA